MLDKNTWSYPSSKETLAAGLFTIAEYVKKRKQIVTPYVNQQQYSMTACVKTLNQ
jgi:hypothetical protein